MSKEEINKLDSINNDRLAGIAYAIYIVVAMLILFGVNEWMAVGYSVGFALAALLAWYHYELIRGMSK